MIDSVTRRQGHLEVFDHAFNGLHGEECLLATEVALQLTIDFFQLQ